MRRHQRAPGREQVLRAAAAALARAAGPGDIADATLAAATALTGRRAQTALTALAGLVVPAAGRVMLSREAAARESAAYFAALTQDASDVILVVGEDGVVRTATGSAAALFGDTAVAGAPIWDLVRPQERDSVARAFGRLLDRSATDVPRRWPLTRPDGARVEVEVSCTDLRQDAAVGGLLLTLRDVTRQRALERLLRHRSYHDALTGLPNRLLFTDRATHALARQRRSGATVAVYVMDLDDFSVINDSLGHAVGDELLMAAAARLSAMTRETDTPARIGADEFAVLIEDAADDAAIEAFAERIVREFSEPFGLIDGPLTVAASVGLATTADSSDAGDLIRHADLALYAAKGDGKRQWRRYQPVLSVSVDKRRELKAAIEEAIAGSAFTLTYQPIMALASREIAGFEALVRWPHPRWGMIHPDQFIPLAEETGHIVRLGAWVLRQAVTDLATWRRRVPRARPLQVSVNVSARQFRDAGFVPGVRDVLSEAKLDPAQLVLELTESVLLRGDERISGQLAELKQLGVQLAIDDFGTGYSSLSYLRELPMDVLKIDRSFIEGMTVSKARLALVEVIIGLAKTLGLRVTAEGIESEVQRELLISLGCEFGQGYLLERPMPANEAEALIRASLPRELHPTRR